MSPLKLNPLEQAAREAAELLVGSGFGQPLRAGPAEPPPPPGEVVLPGSPLSFTVEWRAPSGLRVVLRQELAPSEVNREALLQAISARLAEQAGPSCTHSG
jgi:hypothetical protein